MITLFIIFCVVFVMSLLLGAISENCDVILFTVGCISGIVVCILTGLMLFGGLKWVV